MEKDTPPKHNIIFYIRRFDPERDEAPWLQQFTVQVERGMTILDGLHQIKETQDSSLAWRFSCRMGVCGSCAMLINGKPTLACNTQILEVSDQIITLAPLPNFAIIKDLVPDLTSLFDKHAHIQPYIRRNDLEEMSEPTGEYFQTPQELEKYLQFTYCIKCGCCMAACPTRATDPEYLGPVSLTQAYRYCKDSRDDGFKARKNKVAVSHGVFNCHYAGECSRVCPKGVDPARAIQLMKRELVLDYLKLKRHKKPAHALKCSERVEQKPKVSAPPFTVES
jgi:succinate dehydrogenase / fumarate reductase iron-sulfur subunit